LPKSSALVTIIIFHPGVLLSPPFPPLKTIKTNRTIIFKSSVGYTHKHAAQSQSEAKGNQEHYFKSQNIISYQSAIYILQNFPAPKPT